MTQSPNDILQKIILELQENIKGQGKVLKTLQSVHKQLNLTTKSLAKYNKAGQKASKTITTMHKNLRVLGQVAQKTTRAFGLMTGSIAGLIVVTKKLTAAQEPIAKFAVLSKDASSALKGLGEAYKSLGDNAVTSLKDAAKVMNLFLGKGMVAQVLAARPGVKKAVVKLQEDIINAAGPQIGGELLSRLLGAIPDEKLVLFAEALTENAQGTDEWTKAIAMLGTAAANVIYPLSDALKNMPGVTDPVVRSHLEWVKASKQLTTIFEQFGVKILQEHGDKLTNILNIVSDKLLPAFEKFLNLIIEFPKALAAMAVGYLFFKPLIGVVAIVTTNLLLQHGAVTKLSAAYKVLSARKAAGVLGKVGKLGIAGAAIGAIGWSAHQMYKWGTEGAGSTFGGKMVDKLHRGGPSKSQQLRELETAILERDKIVAAEQGIDVNVYRANRAKRKAAARAKRAGGVGAVGGDKKPDIREFETALTGLIGFRTGLDGLSTSLSSIGGVIASLGPGAEIFGVSAGKMMKEINDQVTESISLGFEKAKAAYDEALALNKAARNAKERTQAVVYMANVQKELGKLAQLAVQNAEKLVAVQEKGRQLQKLQTVIGEKNLQISQALYGTPALAVTALQQIVQSKQKEKEYVQDAMKSEQEKIALLKEELKGKLSAKEIESRLLPYREKLLKLRAEEKSLTAEQLELVKQLRDGYLDAVQAQAFGAGMFEKIIISQEKNLMRGLQARAVKENYLVGQYGKAAGRHKKQAVRFGVGGNILETLSGQNYGASQAIRDLSNIADPIAREISKSSADMVMGLHEAGAAIDRFGVMMAKMAGGTGAFAGGGNRPGTTFIGEGLRKGSVPTPPAAPRASGGKTTKTDGSWHDKMKTVAKILTGLGLELDTLNYEYEAPVGPGGKQTGQVQLQGGP